MEFTSIREFRPTFVGIMRAMVMSIRCDFRAINGEAQRIRAFARRGRLLHRRADATRSMRREGGVTALRALSERGERGGNPMRHSSSLSKG